MADPEDPKSPSDALSELARPASVSQASLTLLGTLGPGIITGAADDDPSGIATYTIAGAQNGFSLLWLAWATWPFMAGVQMMCARIGMMTGRGLAENLGKKLPRPVVFFLCAALLGANLINIAADLAGMGDAVSLLTGLPGFPFVVLFGCFLTFAIIRFKYKPIESVLKWMAVTLLAYVVTPFLIHTPWAHVFHETFHPGLPKDHTGWSTLVAILGTTISPYLFFWQTSEEVEAARSGGRLAAVRRGGSSGVLVRDRVIDVCFGTFVSNLAFFFVVLTAAVTLGAHGVVNIETSKQAAEALRPLAGEASAVLYMAGLVAVGLLAIPTLAGSSAYALADLMKWEQGLDLPFGQAKAFYYVIAASTLGGVFLNFIDLNPVKAMLYSAIVNGLASPIILIGVALVASDRKLMNGKPSSAINLTVVALTTLLMTLAAIGMFL